MLKSSPNLAGRLKTPLLARNSSRTLESILFKSSSWVRVPWEPNSWTTQRLKPKAIQEFDDEGLVSTKVCGVLGKNVKKYSVVSFTDTELLGNVWTFLNNSLKDHFSSGPGIEEQVFVPPSDSEEEIVHLDQCWSSS